MLIILGIVVFVLLVVIHEFGHYAAAKKSGVEVEEFGIGFPPKIAGKIMGKGFWRTYYSINWLPVGGFVKLRGEHDADTAIGSYGAAPFLKKTVIIIAGIAMNFIAAALILSVLSAVGIPKLVEGQFSIASDTEVVDKRVIISYVEPNSPAEIAGIAAGDRLLSLAGSDIDTSSQVSDLTQRYAGQDVNITIQREKNEQVITTVTLENEDGGDGYLGVQTGDYIVERSTWSAPIRGLGLTAQFSWLTLEGIFATVADLLSGNGKDAAENVAGPVGIVVLLRDVSQAGIVPLMFFMSLISITLGVVNVLPIPALDGGRLFVSGIFRLLKKPLSASTEERIHATGMAVLLLLMALITVIDVRRFF